MRGGEEEERGMGEKGRGEEVQRGKGREEREGERRDDVTTQISILSYGINTLRYCLTD
jgi:hypothetical protein